MKRLFSGIWPRLVAALAIGGLAGAGVAQAATTVVKIGIAVPLTGPDANYGKDIENAVKMAIDEANAQKLVIGGQSVQFQPVAQDDQSDPRVAVTVAQNLVDQGVSLVIGHFNSGTTIPSEPIYAKANIPMITPDASNPAITTAGFQTVYRVIASDAQNSGVAGDYVVAGMKAKRIAILDDRTAFGQGEADEFQKVVLAEGGHIVAREFTDAHAVDFSAQLTHVKSAGADVLYCGVLDMQAAQIVRRMKQLGMSTHFVGGGAIADADFIRLAGPAADGAMAWEPGRPLDQLPKAGAFKQAFKAKFGVDVLAYAPFAYDATQAAIQAMRDADSVDPRTYNAKLRTISFPGITGTISFDNDGGLKNAVSTLYAVRNGKWVSVKTTSRD